MIEEDLGEARTLAELVGDGGVPGDEVRRITGEVAAALESAGQRGMHHLDLKPDDVLRTPDGDVRLRGLETAAVRAGEDGTEAEDAARRDAVGVVALTYAGLTGLWPLGAVVLASARAPRVPGGVAAPPRSPPACPATSTPSAASPSTTTRAPPAPATTPARWRRGPRARSWGSPSPARRARCCADAGAASGDAPARLTTPDTLEQPVVVGLAGRRRRRPTPAVVPERPRRCRSAPRWRRSAASGTTASASPRLATAASASGADAGGSRPRAPDAEADATTRVSQVAAPAPAWLSATPVASPAADPEADATTRSLQPVAVSPDTADRADGSSRSAGAAAAGAGAAVVGALGSVGGRVGNLARRAVDKVSELSPDTAPRTDSGDLEAPAPLVPAEPLTKDESKLALGIVVAFVVLALVIGVWGVSRIGSGSAGLGDVAAPATRTTTVAPSSAAPSASGSASPTGTGTGAPPEPLAILKVEAYDPEGDGAENNKLTPKIYDGDTSTGWFSENYRSDTFGGLKKGLGVIVDLGPNKKPQTVELNLPNPSDIEVYVGPDNRLEGATKIGEKADADGTVTFDVPADVSGQYIVVWFTKLNADDSGKRRAWLDEVVVTG